MSAKKEFLRRIREKPMAINFRECPKCGKIYHISFGHTCKPKVKPY